MIQENQVIQLMDNSFEVEDLLDKKIENGNVYYKVKWLGYPPSESSWEPLINLEGASELVNDFENKLKSNLNNEKELFLDSVSSSKLTTPFKSEEGIFEENDDEILITSCKEDFSIQKLFIEEGNIYAKIGYSILFGDEKVPIKKEKIIHINELSEKYPQKLYLFYLLIVHSL